MTIGKRIFLIIAWIVCIALVVGGIVSINENKGTAPEIKSISDVDLSKESVSSDVYIEEAYILNRYVTVDSVTETDAEGADDTYYYVYPDQPYPTSDRTFLEEDSPDFERYIVMFYDSTGTAYVATLENGTDELSVRLGDNDGKPVKIFLYATVDSETFTAQNNHKEYGEEVRKLDEKNLAKYAKTKNAEIANFGLSYEYESAEDYEEYNEFKVLMDYTVVMIVPGAIGILLLIRGIFKRRKLKNAKIDE